MIDDVIFTHDQYLEVYSRKDKTGNRFGFRNMVFKPNRKWTWGVMPYKISEEFLQWGTYDEIAIIINTFNEIFKDPWTSQGSCIELR